MDILCPILRRRDDVGLAYHLFGWRDAGVVRVARVALFWGTGAMTDSRPEITAAVEGRNIFVSLGDGHGSRLVTIDEAFALQCQLGATIERARSGSWTPEHGGTCPRCKQDHCGATCPPLGIFDPPLEMASDTHLVMSPQQETWRDRESML
jgi:hypothetical protein